jgi:tetratricopeptide (TPR) repeat protein
VKAESTMCAKSSLPIGEQLPDLSREKTADKPFSRIRALVLVATFASNLALTASAEPESPSNEGTEVHAVRETPVNEITESHAGKESPNNEGTEAHTHQQPEAKPSKEAAFGDSDLLESTFKKVAVSVTHEKENTTADDLDDVSGDTWKRQYTTGRDACEKRVYDQAEHRLMEAIKSVKRGIVNERELVLTRIALADVYLATDKIDEAEKLYSWCVGAAKHLFGPESDAEAHAQQGLASVFLIKQKYAEAQILCKDALRTQRKLLGDTDHDYGQSLITMGCILSHQGFNEQADRFFDRGLGLLQQNPGPKQLDYADGLRQVALVRQSQGGRADAQELFEKSYAIKDRAIDFNQTTQLKGTVRFQWEGGSPRAQEIPDAVVPLRYMCSKNIRVACAVIDLWELFGLLISVTNIGDQREDIGLGKITFVRASGNIAYPQAEKLELIAPDHIDRIRREVDIWRLTATKPWFANMEKNRNIRGLVPAHGHDLFRGPNVFGIYGEWNAQARVLPDKFALEPSPEHVEEQAQVIVDPGLVHSSNMKILGLTPVTLEPFESRTGELFYMNPRCEHVLLRVVVGNTVFDFPFTMPKKRTGF